MFISTYFKLSFMPGSGDTVVKRQSLVFTVKNLRNKHCINSHANNYLPTTWVNTLKTTICYDWSM